MTSLRSQKTQPELQGSSSVTSPTKRKEKADSTAKLQALQARLGNRAVAHLFRNAIAEARQKVATDTTEMDGGEPVSSSNRSEDSDKAAKKESRPPKKKPARFDSTPAKPAAKEKKGSAKGVPPQRENVPSNTNSNPFLTFASSTASQIAQNISGVAAAVQSSLSSDRSSVAQQAPSIQVSLPGEQLPKPKEKKPSKSSPLPTAESIQLTESKEVDGLTQAELEVPSQPEGAAVNASAGAVPQAKLEGNADPAQIDDVSGQSKIVGAQIREQVSGDLQALAAGVTISKIGVEREERISLSEGQSISELTASEDMQHYVATDVPANVRAIADANFAPLLESSLAEPKQRAQEVFQQRDSDRERTFAEAQAEAKAAKAEALEEQKNAVKHGYQQVAAERDKGLQEGRQQLTEFEGEVQRRGLSQDEQIKKKVADEQEKANNAIKDGEEKARNRELAAKEEELRKREEFERTRPQEPEKSWYERVWDRFKEAVASWAERLVNAVKKVFGKAKQAIAKALTFAKNLAIGFIRGLRTAIVGMLKVFAAGLRVLVNGLLVTFPKLRDRVNAAIDSAVETAVAAVHAVASRLEETVTKLVDSVQSAINKILDVCELAITTQIRVVGAVLTGNFSDAAKILFLAACQAVGIPGEQFLETLSRAGKSLLDIIKHPAQFLGNLLKAVGQGLSSFVGNFPQRLMQGLTGWLFGQVAQGGIRLPKVVDLKSIFMLLLQVMGITYDYIRTRVVNRIGERAAGVIEKVMTSIHTLFTKGPGELWSYLAQEAAQVKEAVMQAASEWIVTKILTQAAVKLGSLFTPVGAFVQAVLTMYDTITFFIEKIQEIAAWVKSILSSLKSIAAGAISAAANYFDQSMSRTIPLIIGFLAKFAGIDGIGEKIRQIVTKLRAPVDKAIDFVLDKLIAIAKSSWGGVKSGASAVKQTIVDWWKTRVGFRSKDGRHHTLFFIERSGYVELAIASKPQDFAMYLEQIKKRADVDPVAISDIQSRYLEIERLKLKAGSTKGKDRTNLSQQIKQKLSDLAVAIRELPSPEGLAAGSSVVLKDQPIGSRRAEIEGFEHYHDTLLLKMKIKEATQRSEKSPRLISRMLSIAEVEKRIGSGDFVLKEELRRFLLANRPAHKPGFAQLVWDRAPKRTNADGEKLPFDPVSKREIRWDKSADRNKQWHLGHIKERKYSKLVDELCNGIITWERFMEFHHDPETYQVEGARENLQGLSE